MSGVLTLINIFVCGHSRFNQIDVSASFCIQALIPEYNYAAPSCIQRTRLNQLLYCCIQNGKAGYNKFVSVTLSTHLNKTKKSGFLIYENVQTI